MVMLNIKSSSLERLKIVVCKERIFKFGTTNFFLLEKCHDRSTYLQGIKWNQNDRRLDENYCCTDSYKNIDLRVYRWYIIVIENFA